MFVSHAEDGYVAAATGMTRRTLSYGAGMLMVEFRLVAGHELAAHRHRHEQTGYLVGGRLRLRIGGEEYEVGPGDSWSIPGDVEHEATALDDSVAVEVFTPLREDLLPPPEAQAAEPGA
jgi:quercetin dioxygenase-like cupin family protein